MATSQISITAAFSEAWERMTAILFRPFDLGKWFALGFTAWLASLVGNGGGGGGGGGGSSWNLDGASDAQGDLRSVGDSAEAVLREIWERSTQWLLDNPLWAIAGIFGCGLLVALFLVILWVSSRGKFMFLDNVIHDRAEVIAPWKRYRRLGNSHFFFQLVFSIVAIVFVVGLVAAILGLIGWGSVADFDTPVSCVVLAVGVFLLLLIIVTVLYIQYFLDAFVVPLMYRYDLRVMAAWGRFGGIFSQHTGTVLLSGLFVFVLAIAVGLAILVSGLLTCCIGFLFLMIPYIGTVLTLPVPVTFRAFTVALLNQIDPGYFPQKTSEAPVPIPPGPTEAAPEASSPTV
jgi:hypothetical protein